jgi:hypothetical protein
MPKNIYKTYDDAQERTHDVVLDGETGEVISDVIEYELDPDEIREKEMEDK